MYLICGEALFDFFLAREKGPGALGFDARAGGSPFNVAIGVARRGGRAALLTGMSDDMLGARLAALLEEEGVETSYLVRSGRRTTVSLVDLSCDGQPKYAFYGVGSADTALTEDDLPPLGPEFYGLHFGSYSIAVEPVADAFAALARRAEKLFISLDPNVRATVEKDIGAWRRRIDGLSPYANLIKASVEDLGLLYPDASLEAIAEGWLAAGPELVVFTDGGETATAYTKKLRVAVTPPACTIVDTVGAGDAFQASLLADLAKNDAPLDAVRRLTERRMERLLSNAAKVAARTCARRGADIPRIAASKRAAAQSAAE